MNSGDIPRTYLDFVRGGNAEPLVPIFLHNQMDLRGLAGLAGRILSIFGDQEKPLEDGLELYGLSRICERRGQAERARTTYEMSIGAALPAETDRAARASLAQLAKRDRDFDRARELWESMLGNSREGYQAYEQLAIYYEHEVRNTRMALATTREALAQLRRAHRLAMIAVDREVSMAVKHSVVMEKKERKASRSRRAPLRPAATHEALLSHAETDALPEQTTALDPRHYLAKIDTGKTVREYREKEVAFSQGDTADAVFYIQSGKVQLTVVSKSGKEAVVAILRTFA